MSQYEHSYAGRWQQPPVTAQPKRRWWTFRRKFFAALSAAALALIAFGVLRALPAALTHPDYHDAGQLAQAVQAHEHGVSADCAHLTGTRYTCAVGFTGGAIGSYTVTVAADGSSWLAS